MPSRHKETPMYFILYRSEKNSQWYWNLNSDNHKVIATGAEGYVNKQDALHGINLVKTNAASAMVYDKSQEKFV
jgi:uncharacterized protein YegP (UPF0339 family)